jgi:propionyl-CoA carboxylase beta chain
MGSRQLRADATFAWPTARIAAAGPQAAAAAAAGELADAPDPDARLAELVEEWGRRASPDRAVAAGHLDGVIAPSDTRRRVVQALRLLRTKRETLPPKKHGNIPL